MAAPEVVLGPPGRMQPELQTSFVAPGPEVLPPGEDGSLMREGCAYAVRDRRTGWSG